MEIPKTAALEEKVFAVSNEKELSGIVREVFLFQYANNPVYRTFCDALGRNPGSVHVPEQIPFLPISLFKSHRVVSGEFQPELVFESSGTTGQVPSRHLVRSASMYKQSFSHCFQQFYGPVNRYCMLGLLPSYLERSASSLVYMVKDLVEKSGHPLSGFYLYDHRKLSHTLHELEAGAHPVILVGVTYALLDFAANFPMKLSHTTVMETGGMKGKKKEMVRGEVHQVLKEAFGLDNIHSEYGMTELLSQAYSKGDGVFQCPPWMKVLIRDDTDPLSVVGPGGRQASGGLNIIDLANLYSCSFIATEDAGRLHPDGSFEVLGRLDHAEARGCSLMLG